MGMDMIPVAVGGHYDLKAGELLCQLQSNFVSHFRSHRVIGPEGLHHMIVHSTLGVAVQAFGVHEFLQSQLGNAVDAADQPAALVVDLFLLTAVFQNAVQTANGLGTGVFDKTDDGHYFHRLVLRMSESRELTAA